MFLKQHERCDHFLFAHVTVFDKPRPSQDHLVSVLGVASTVAHELGHNLGMRHDTAERRCSCDNEPRLGGCIMEPSTGSVL